MALRVKRKAKRKTVRTRRAKGKSAAKKATLVNKKAQWKAYKELQTRVKKAWTKLQSNVKKNAGPKVLMRDRNHLLLLLGECNYMSRQCARLARKAKRR